MSTQAKMNRRRFLIWIGSIVGGGVLTCAGLAGVSLWQPAVEYPEPSCRTGEKMNNKILVVYASRAGSTAGVAETIGKTLCEKGAAVDVRQVKDVADVGAYQAVIVGSPIYMGQLMPEAVKFVEKHRDALSKIPTAYFTVCTTMREDTEENRRTVTGYLSPVTSLVKPVDMGLFAEAVITSKLPLLYRLMVKAMKEAEGDWRNWDAIRAWTGEIYPQLSIS